MNVLHNEPSPWRLLFPRPKPDGHKYDRGHAVVLGGPVACAGAAKLSARAALRVGAGLVSVACDPSALMVYATAFQSIMTKPFKDVPAYETLIEDPRVRAVLLGPGAGVNDRTRELVLTALRLQKPVVLDADALTVFADAPAQLFNAIGSPAILTPHEGEFARLWAITGTHVERAQEAARASRAVVVLKGCETVIASPDGRLALNKAATPYLATAGSGDVLAGLCTGLLAQGMPAFEAACAAVWVHTQAGNAVGAGVISEDMVEQIPSVLKRLEKESVKSLHSAPHCVT